MKRKADIVRPQLFRSQQELPHGTRVLDLYESSMRELYFVEHPAAKKDEPPEQEIAAYLARVKEEPVWVYYPWRSLAVRIPSEVRYFKLRTARNRNLITEDEQQGYRNAVVGIAGLSVGSAALSTLAATGGPRRLKLADPDTIELTNLNRMRANLSDVGTNKAEVAARAVWELDPFADIELWQHGITADTVTQFVDDLDVVVDEMDNIALKIALREAARAAKKPVVMATDNGDGAILDVERFDLEPERPLFHGRISLATPPEKLSREEFVDLSSQIIDVSLFTSRQAASIVAIGKTLSGVAQIATAAAVAGAFAAYAVRLIICGEKLPSGRYVVSTEAALQNPIS